ncbi:hypothetical protein ACFX16_031653 [Malus domestica]
MPNIPAAHETRNLLISLNRQPGPSQVQEPKGHEPCGSPSTAPQRHNLRPLAAQAALGSSQAKLPKQWSLPRHILNPCRASSWPLPADLPHHPDGYPAIALSKNKARKIKFFLHWCGTKKTKKATKDGPLHEQDVEDC